ncbi:hypothetical protein Dimus_011022, partial [Dionaea muscipula]
DLVRVPDGPIIRVRAREHQEASDGLVRRVLAQSYSWSSSREAVESCRSLLHVRKEEMQKDQAPDGIEHASDQLPKIKPRVSVP